MCFDLESGLATVRLDSVARSDASNVDSVNAVTPLHPTITCSAAFTRARASSKTNRSKVALATYKLNGSRLERLNSHCRNGRLMVSSTPDSVRLCHCTALLNEARMSNTDHLKSPWNPGSKLAVIYFLIALVLQGLLMTQDPTGPLAWLEKLSILVPAVAGIAATHAYRKGLKDGSGAA